MTTKKLSDLTELTATATGDYTHVVDISDTADDPAGSSRKVKLSNLLPDTAVSPGTYGDATHVAAITVNAKGQVTAASAVAISGVGGGGGISALTGDVTASGTGSVAATVTKINGQTPAAVATSGAYGDLSGKPNLAAVATTGAYGDLTGKPSLGSAASLAAGSANGVATLGSDGKVPSSQLPPTSNAVTSVAGKTGAVTLSASDVSGLAAVAASGAYADLTGKPALGSAAALTAGAANGVATLDSGGKIPAGQIPAGGSSTLATLLKSSAVVPVTQDSTSYAANIDGVANRAASALTINMLGDSFGVQAIYQPTDLDLSTYQTWTAGQTYVLNEVVKFNGYVFFTNTGGTAGSTAPTPAVPSDGTITWVHLPPLASKFGSSLLQAIEIFSNGRLRWDMAQGYKSTNLGIGKIFITDPGNNYVAPYVNPINGVRVSVQQTAGKVTGVTVLSPGRSTGQFVLNILDTGPGSGAKLHVTGGGGTFSVSGCVTADFVTRLPDAIASSADIFIIGAPNNDINASIPTATTIANIKTCAEQLVAAGKKAVLMAQTPGAVFSDAQKLLMQRYNRWGRDFCGKAAWANTNGICAIAWADASGYMTDGATDALPIGGSGGVIGAMTSDGLHTSSRGTMYQAIVAMEAMRNWIGEPPSYPSRAYSAFDPYDPVVNPGGNRFEALPWVGTQAIIVGQTRTNVGNVYVATTGGTTSSATPPTGIGTGIADGSVVWSYCFPAKMSVSLSAANGGSTSNLSGITVSGNPIRGAQLARSTGSATGTIAFSVEAPWSNGQAGQRQVINFSLGGGSASERFQYTMQFANLDRFGILPADLGVKPFVFEVEWEISNVALLSQFQSSWGLANAGFSDLGTGREIMQSVGEMRAIPNGGKIIQRSQPMILPPNQTTLAFNTYFGFTANGAANSATAIAKLNHFTFREAYRL